MSKPRRFKAIDVNPKDHPKYNPLGYIPGNAGWVYVVRFGDEVKIGLTSWPFARMDGLQLEKQASLDEVYFIVCDEMRMAERAIHNAFKAYRLEGEWFKLSHIQVEILRTIQEYKDGKFYCKNEP